MAAGEAGVLDVARLRECFAAVAAHGDELALFFYSDLFLRHPETRELFPVSMSAQRGHFTDALVKIVAQADRAEELTGFLQGLGRDHRKFGAVADHYDAVGVSLLATLQHFAGPAWSPEVAADWKEAYQLIGSVMNRAAADDEAEQRPAWWTGTVVGFERRGFDVAVLSVRPEPRLEYSPGQSVAIECPARPRLWRYYSMANAPRPDGLLEFHVRLVDGGAVSMALTSEAIEGAQLRLGPPVGALTLDGTCTRNLLLVAGSTGLAPLKAILEQVAALGDPPKVDLFFGAATAEGLYDLDALEKLAAQHPWLVLTAVAGQPGPGFAGQAGTLPEVVARSGDWSRREAYLAGPSEMVAETVTRLAAAGLARDRIHVEDFGWSER
jgi:NAD(P)H-flavin reductase/hemoglobin-like flavoprotein